MSLIHPWSEFWLSKLILKVQRKSMSLESWLDLWRLLEVPDWSLASWSRFWYGHWSFVPACLRFWLSILNFKVQRTSMSIKSCFGALEDAGGSWLGLDIFVFIWIGSVVFGTPIFQIIALYLDFEGAKNISFLQVLIWGFGGRWRFLTGVWHLDLGLDMVTRLWYIYDSNFGSLSWCWRWKEHPNPSRPDLELLRMPLVPDWCLESWSRFGNGHWSLIHPWSKYRFSILILKVQRTSMSLKSWFGALEGAGGSWLEFDILIMIWIWSLVFGTSMFQILALYLHFPGAEIIHVL